MALRAVRLGAGFMVGSPRPQRRTVLGSTVGVVGATPTPGDLGWLFSSAAMGNVIPQGYSPRFAQPGSTCLRVFVLSAQT